MIRSEVDKCLVPYFVYVLMKVTIDRQQDRYILYTVKH